MFLCWVSAVRYGETDEGQQYQQDASQPDFCWWRDGSDGNGYFDPACGQIAVSQDVTHWMPLPAAPVEQKGNLCVNCEADGKCMKRQALCYASGTAQAYSPERLQEVALLRRRVSELEEELAVSDKLLRHREYLLQAIPGCPEHGNECVPHALDWIESAKLAMQKPKT